MSNDKSIYEETVDDYDDFEHAFDEIIEHERKMTERYNQALERYASEAAALWGDTDFDEIKDLWFNPDEYTSITHMGHCTVKPYGENSFKIETFEKADDFETDIDRIENRVYKEQTFIEPDGPTMLIRQQTLGWSEDSFSGEMLFPIPDSDKYWMVCYLI